MSAQNDGGPAFPDLKATKVESNYGGVYVDKYEAIGGLSMRDYFAAKAVAGLLASDVRSDCDKFATYAYKVADAMLEARQK